MRYTSARIDRLDVINLLASTAVLTQADCYKILVFFCIYTVLAGPIYQRFSAARSKDLKHDKDSLIGQYVHLAKQLCFNFFLVGNVFQLFCSGRITNLRCPPTQHYEKVSAFLYVIQPMQYFSILPQKPLVSHPFLAIPQYQIMK
jgi:hypothetical protein